MISFASRCCCPMKADLVKACLASRLCNSQVEETHHPNTTKLQQVRSGSSYNQALAPAQVLQERTILSSASRACNPDGCTRCSAENCCMPCSATSWVKKIIPLVRIVEAGLAGRARGRSKIPWKWRIAGIAMATLWTSRVPPVSGLVRQGSVTKSSVPNLLLFVTSSG